MTESIDPLKTVQPLTHLREDGRTVYTRRQQIEVSIQTQFGLSREELVRRARLQEGVAEFLHDEVLVYFIRAYHAHNDDSMILHLATVLLERHTQRLVRQFRKLGLNKADAETAAHEVMCDITVAAIKLDSGIGDYFQVNFADALRRKYLTARPREIRELRLARSHVSLSTSTPMSSGSSDDEEGGLFTHDMDLLQSSHAADDAVLVAERTRLLDGALEAIKDSRHREAYVLRHCEEWPITAKDPTDPCLSRHFDCDAKTIHNWLKTAEANLTNWRETQQ